MKFFILILPGLLCWNQIAHSQVYISPIIEEIQQKQYESFDFIFSQERNQLIDQEIENCLKAAREGRIRDLPHGVTSNDSYEIEIAGNKRPELIKLSSTLMTLVHVIRNMNEEDGELDRSLIFFEKLKERGFTQEAWDRFLAITDSEPFLVETIERETEDFKQQNLRAILETFQTGHKTDADIRELLANNEKIASRALERIEERLAFEIVKTTPRHELRILAKYAIETFVPGSKRFFYHYDASNVQEIFDHLRIFASREKPKGERQ